MVFIHIPMKEKIGGLETLAKTFMDIANYTK